MAKEIKFNIKIAVDGKEQIATLTTSTKELQGMLKGAKDKATNLRETLIGFNQVVQTFQTLQSSVQQFLGVLNQFSSAYATQAEAETKLENNMRANIDATDEEIQSIKDLCAAQQQLGVIGDEVQLAGAQELAVHLKTTSALKKLIPAMNDLAAKRDGLNVTEQTATQVALLLGKAMDGNVSALKRVGIVLTENQQELMKTGDEMTRAATLAEAIESKVGGMNAALAQTTPGQIKQMGNAFGDLYEGIGAVIAPYSQLLAKIGQTAIFANALYQLTVNVKAVTKVIAGWAVVQKVASMNTKIATAVVGLFTGGMTGATVATGAATAAVKALTWALRALEMASVIGTVFAVASMAIGALGGSADSAADSLDNLSAAERRAKEEAERHQAVQDAFDNTMQQSFGTMMTSYKMLQEAWKGLRSEHEKISWIKANQQAFHELGMQVNGVTDAENVFVKNTDAVVSAIQARARAAARQAQLTELYKEQIKLEDEKRQREASIKADAKASGRSAKAGDPVPEDYRNSRYAEVNGAGDWVFTERGAKLYSGKDVSTASSVSKLQGKINDNQEEIDRVTDLLAEDNAAVADAMKKVGIGGGNGIAGNGNKTGHGNGGKNKEFSLVANPKTYKDLTNNVSYYQQEIEKADATDFEHLQTLVKKKAAAEAAVEAFKAMTESMGMPAELKSLDDYDKKLQILRKRRSSADDEHIAKIDEEIAATEAAKKALENTSIAAMRTEEIKTYDQLNKKLAYYDDLLKSGDEAQRKSAQENILALNRMQEAWDKQLARMKLPTTTDNVKDIDDMIAFYTEEQQQQDADEIQKTQEKIDALTAKKRVLTLGVELPQMQKEIDDIKALTGKELSVKIKGMGFDELTEKIKELNKLLGDTENPVTDSQRKQIEGMIATYEEWRKKSAMSFDTLNKGWDSVKGVGNGIQSVTDALQGNMDAWSAITGVVDGFIQVYQGIQSVIGIIEMLTAATRSHGAAEAEKAMQTEVSTATTTAETAATIANTAATVADTAASITNTAAKSGEAVAEATESGAKLPFPYNIAAIAAGVAAVLGALAVVGSFATGGIVGGNSPTGDKLLARVNSGEMILNKLQQMRLLSMLNSGVNVALPRVSLPQREDLRISVAPNMVQPAEGLRGDVVFKIKNRALVGTIANEKRLSRKAARMMA